MGEFEAEIAYGDMATREAPAGVGLCLREPLAASLREREGSVDYPDATGTAVAPPAAGKFDAEVMQQFLEFRTSRNGKATVARR
jgi:hypothetical protein